MIYPETAASIRTARLITMMTLRPRPDAETEKYFDSAITIIFVTTICCVERSEETFSLQRDIAQPELRTHDVLVARCAGAEDAELRLPASQAHGVHVQHLGLGVRHHVRAEQGHQGGLRHAGNLLVHQVDLQQMTVIKSLITGHLKPHYCQI